MADTTPDLANFLVQQGLCASQEEANAIVEWLDVSSGEKNNDMWTSLQDYIDLTNEEVTTYSKQWRKQQHMDQESSDEEEPEEVPTDSLLDENDDEDGALVQDGECPLCERFIALTRHHLIPRETWPRIVPKLRHAADLVLENNNQDSIQYQKAKDILGHGLEYWLEAFVQDLDGINPPASQWKHRLACHTIDICRPCHSHIHKTHDNLTLALDYSSLEALVQDEQIAKFCKWAHKQKVGKYKSRFAR